MRHTVRILLPALLILLPSAAWPIVTGLCVNCHTMHNSQDGKSMQWGDINNVTGADPNAQNVLLRDGCVACHTGKNDGKNISPYVMSTTAPGYGTAGIGGETLAGGSFWWVAEPAALADSKGHNVITDGLTTGGDGRLTRPPGYIGSLDFSTGMNCAGTRGCHGNRSITGDFTAMRGTHHANDKDIDGASPGTSYRFLNGVLGLEDPDWEYTVSTNDHNQYYGVDRPNDSDTTFSGTISGLCGQCHNDFHNGSGKIQGATGGFASPWVRHPTDFDMGNTAAGSEYRAYGGAGANAYDFYVPVASTDVTQIIAKVNFSDDTIITCISCHRAHGTPFASSLRWNNRGWPAPEVYNGCGACHTTKD